MRIRSHAKEVYHGTKLALWTGYKSMTDFRTEQWEWDTGKSHLLLSLPHLSINIATTKTTILQSVGRYVSINEQRSCQFAINP